MRARPRDCAEPLGKVCACQLSRPEIPASIDSQHGRPGLGKRNQRRVVFRGLMRRIFVVLGRRVLVDRRQSASTSTGLVA